ncbi:hypothetical protein QUC31_005983 [Theobroma cacao]|uniref:Transcription factor iws1 n=2 Tax=Theobroma cacao TaxID=3641 RepID=A0AB32X0E1_THECC|nr:PREDICTED: transcription factor iws1 [Theobroma cacao]EOY19721.1 Transcription elongation factor (TFIIS) family protein, putative [Theobroma cacao]
MDSNQVRRQKRRASERSKDVKEMWEFLTSDQNNQQTHSDNVKQTKYEVDVEIEEMFDRVKRRKKMEEKSPRETALLAEKVMAMLEVAAEDDAELIRQEKPAINKIQMLPLLLDFLSKRKLQGEFLDHGVLSLLKNWLEPLPDGSLPNATLRAAILNMLTQVLPIDIEREDRREQLKKSGLGKVIMFLSKSDEEITANKRLAKDLIEHWSRTIFSKSVQFSDLRYIEENMAVPFRKPSLKKPEKQQAPLTMEPVRVADFDLELDLRITKASDDKSSSSQQRASRPEATPSVYLVRPQSNFNPHIVKSYRRQQVKGDRRARIEERLKRLKRSNKKPLQTAKLGAQGRGIFTYL